MKSPINGEPMTLVTTEKELIIKKKTVNYMHKSFLCEESGLTFTTTEQDTYNLERALEAHHELTKPEDNLYKYWLIPIVLIGGALLIAFLL